MKLNSKDIRRCLPGASIKQVLVFDDHRQLIININVNGWLDEIIVTNPSYSLFVDGKHYQTFSNIAEAIKVWDKI